MTGSVAIGIDSGATKTEVLATDGQHEYGAVLPDGINFQRLGMDETVRRLADVLRSLSSHVALADSVRVCVGLAGADDSEDRELIRKGLEIELARTKSLANVSEIGIIQDSVAALEAAFPQATGAVVIIGTGSIAIARNSEGRVFRTGGWGYLLGDEGSGYRIGLAALQWLARTIDGGEVTDFGRAVLGALSADSRSDLIHRVYREAGLVQTVAPVAIEWAEAGDSVANRILSEQAAGVAECFRKLVATMSGQFSKEYALTGGLSDAPAYRSMVCSHIESVAEDWVLVEPAHPRPVFGALSLAS